MLNSSHLTRSKDKKSVTVADVLDRTQTATSVAQSQVDWNDRSIESRRFTSPAVQHNQDIKITQIDELNKTITPIRIPF